MAPGGFYSCFSGHAGNVASKDRGCELKNLGASLNLTEKLGGVPEFEPVSYLPEYFFITGHWVLSGFDF